MRKGLRIGLLFFLFCIYPPVFAAKSITIGIINDNTAQPLIPIALIQEEINTLTAGEFVVQIPENKRLSGDGTLAGVRNRIKQQLADPQVDIIITLGLVSSQQIAQMPELNKPVIAAFVLDRELQGFPYQFGASGKHNLAYLTTQKSIAKDLATFHDMVGFKHLAILINPLWLETLPQLKRMLSQVEKEQNIDIAVVNASQNVTAMLDAMPNSTEAVYVAPLLSYSEKDTKELADQLISRGLPSFSSIGQQGVELGLLAALGGLPEDKIRFARRIALDVQSIILGDEAGDLNVIFDDNPKLTINMQTARAIGFSPGWRYLLEASLLYAEAPIGKKLTLYQAMHDALNANLELQVNELFVYVAGENVDLARANLLPQIVASINNQQMDAQDPLRAIGIAENMTTGTLGAQQSIYSDNFWANFRISQYLEDAEDYKFYGQMLDTLEETGAAYLNVLRAMAVKDVRRANLTVTEKNLDLARMRERVGFSSRADVLRWESQLAFRSTIFIRGGRSSFAIANRIKSFIEFTTR